MRRVGFVGSKKKSHRIGFAYITQREIELNPKNEQEKRLQVLYARVWDFEPLAVV